MQRFEMTPQSAFQAVPLAGAERVTAFLRKVYGWMFVGLGVTSAVAFAVAGSPALTQAIFGKMFLFFGHIIEDLPDHYPRAFERRFPMADFRIGHDVSAQFDSRRCLFGMGAFAISHAGNLWRVAPLDKAVVPQSLARIFLVVSAPLCKRCAI